MKRLTIHLIALLLIFTASHAQVVIDVGDADYIRKTGTTSELMFIKKLSNNTHQRTTLTIIHRNPSIKIDTIPQRNNDHPNLIPIEEIKPFSPQQWKELLIGKTFLLKKDSTSIETLTAYNQSLMSTNTYYGSDHDYGSTKIVKEYNYPYYNVGFEFYSYVLIKLQNDKYITAVIYPDKNYSHFKEVLLPYDYKIDFMTRNYSIDYAGGYENEIGSNTLDNQRVNYDHIIEERTTSDGKKELLDFMCQPLNIVADSIDFIDNNIITYNQSSKLHNIYTFYGKKLPIDNIRATKNLRYNIQLLIGNDLKYLVNNQLSDTIPIFPMWVCGTVPYYHDEIKKDKHGNFSLIKNSNLSIVAGKNTRITYKIKETNDIENILFVDGQTEIHYNGNNYSELQNSIFFLKKKNGKYNIATYQIDEKRKTIALTQQLPQDCDSLIMQYPTYFYSKGLVGVYPTMNTAKYKWIDIGYNFLRYEDTQGKSGWVDMDTAEEYPDW